MKPVKDLFHIRYGNQFDFSKMEMSTDETGINFISRGSTNNGFMAKVQRYRDTEPFPAGLITVTMGGSYLLASFVQPAPFYTAQNIKVLCPKNPMSLQEKLFYCAVFQHNRFRYHSHSREANSTFDDILIPEKEDIPDWVYSKNMIKPSSDRIGTHHILTDCHKWKWFRYDEVFDIRKGFYNKKPDFSSGHEIPFIGATDTNNGITGFYALQDIERASKTGQEPNQDLEQKIFKGNCLTVSNNGSIGYAFYQEKAFTCSHDVNPLYLKDRPMTKYIALFLATLIEKEQFRWAYGRKWRPKRMPASLIKLPIDSNEKPDWNYMEDYMKGLAYSSSL